MCRCGLLTVGDSTCVVWWEVSGLQANQGHGKVGLLRKQRHRELEQCL